MNEIQCNSTQEGTPISKNEIRKALDALSVNFHVS
jgi:hypothetical protein